MEKPLFELSFTGYGLLCMLAAGAGLAATLPGTLTRRDLGWAAWVRFAVCTVFFGLLCARLAYVVPDLIMGILSRNDVILEHNSIYLDAIGSALPALRFWEGGYALAGAIPGAILGAKLAEKWTGAPRGFFRDQLSLGLPVFLLVERIAGMETLYFMEALLALAVLAVMIVLHIRRRGRDTNGDLLRIFLVIFCLPFAWIESFRPLTGHMVIHFVNITQVAAALFGLIPAVRWSVELKRSRASARTKAVLLAGGWAAIAALIGTTVYCIFGMEKDWLDRTLAHVLIAVTLALTGAIALYIRHAGQGKGGAARGARED